MASSKSENTKRLARNTLYLYFRSIFCLVLSLYSSRLILAALGVDDYGINNAVAGFASMFTLVTGSLSSAISRFLTFEQGTGNKERQKQVFSMSLNLMICFAILIFILAQTAGLWFVQNKMTIPDGRETAAVWAFECAVFSVMIGLIVSPFNSAIIAHEKMGIYAVISVWEAIMRVGLALYLTYGHYTMDRLILYTVIWTACSLALKVFAIGYSALKFPECRFRLIRDRKLAGELYGYAGWNFVGSFSNTLAGQGVNMLLNIFCGPAVNAARGLSNTVQSAIQMFVNNFTLALTPQITKAYASKDLPYVKYLVYRGGRFSFFIMFLISLPVLLEADFVFTLWLGDVPAHTVNFNRLALIACLIDLMYYNFGTVQNASGNIRNYRLMTSACTLIQFPLSWISLKLGASPEVVIAVMYVSSFFRFIGTYFIVKKTIPYTFQELLSEMYLPEIKVVICSTVIPLVVSFLLPYGWLRFLIVCSLCVLFFVPSILFIGCNQSERVFILNAVRQKINTVFSKSA